MRVLVLRFDGPLMAFGAPVVDNNGVIQKFPGLSLLTGLFGNALGWDHRDTRSLSDLQDRIRYSARIDRPGVALVDYQSVDLGQDWMLPEKAGWTTRGRIAERGGASATGTHLRFRHFRADSHVTVCATVVGEGGPSVDEIAEALRRPARPLFLGRKCCLPARPLLERVVDAESVLSALISAPRVDRGASGPLPATWWDGEEVGPGGEGGLATVVTDERDWTNQIHVGRRMMWEGRVDPPEAHDG